MISLTDIFFIALAILRVYIIINKKTQKVKKKERSYTDEKIALKNGDNKKFYTKSLILRVKTILF